MLFDALKVFLIIVHLNQVVLQVFANFVSLLQFMYLIFLISTIFLRQIQYLKHSKAAYNLLLIKIINKRNGKTLTAGYHAALMLFKDIFPARNLYMETFFSLYLFSPTWYTLAYDCRPNGKMLFFWNTLLATTVSYDITLL